MADGLVDVHAYAVSATVQPKAVEVIFGPGAERVRLTKTIVVARRGEREWFVAHDFGAIVFFDVAAAERERVMKSICSLEQETRAPLEETFQVQVSAGEAPTVKFDRVVVAELDARRVEIVALVIAQSVAMEYYEGDVDSMVAELQRQSRRMAKDGALRGSASQLVRVIGQGMTMRSQVMHTLSLLDSPGATWESEPLDRLYRGLRAAFEIDERYRALDHELRLVQDNLALMVDMIRQRRYTFLEVTVAVFVVAETLLFVAELVRGH
jgi:uncharacterized Rmd1/YagE family protein